jgi:hypothetical protein
MRMCYIAVLGHIAFEEFFGFLNFPDTQPGVFVDLMLKKNWHPLLIRTYFAALNC